LIAIEAQRRFPRPAGAQDAVTIRQGDPASRDGQTARRLLIVSRLRGDVRAEYNRSLRWPGGSLFMKRYLAAVSALLLSGLGACSLERPEIDQLAQAKLIGLSGPAVRGCLGQPAIRRRVGSTEIWSYENGRVEIEGSGFATVGHARHASCRVNIFLTRGAVSQVNYAGPAGDPLDAGERCVFPVAACIGP
jgi:hypothetical protein